MRTTSPGLLSGSAPPPDSPYTLLPFNFSRLPDGRYLVTNDLGKFLALEAGDFTHLVSKTLSSTTATYKTLKASAFLSDASSSVNAYLLASQYRTKKAFLEGSAKLHIFVPTLRCNHTCSYCQVSRQSEDRHRYDMTPEIARRSVELALAGPSSSITIELQGGECLLSFDLVRVIVDHALQLNVDRDKHIDFVICSNLSTLNDEHLEYCIQNHIGISTSLDGPKHVHDANRRFTGASSYDTAVRGIRMAQEALGKQNVSALMTTARDSLTAARAIVDEYLALDLGSMFVRELNPYGFALRNWDSTSYTTEEFLAFYKEVLSYIIEVNRTGRTFSEAYAAILLRKILTPFSTGFVDLQSPTGSGFGVVVYNYDGEVYASDESRMLAEMGDATFRLGNVCENTYEEIFLGEKIQTIAAMACNESLAGCAECVFQPYCGADPVRHYATQGDMYGHRSTSSFCKKNAGILSHLFQLVLSEDEELNAIFWAWINHESVAATKLPGDA